VLTGNRKWEIEASVGHSAVLYREEEAGGTGMKVLATPGKSRGGG